MPGPVHELKVWPEHYRAIIGDLKPFEVRKDDRGFAPKDYLFLREWCPKEQDYTGRHVHAQVLSILRGGQFGIEPGYVVMGIRVLR